MGIITSRIGRPNGKTTWLALALLTSGFLWFVENAVESLEKTEDKVATQQAQISSIESHVDYVDDRLDRIETKLDILIQRRRK